MTEVWFWIEQTPRKTSFGKEAFVITATVGQEKSLRENVWNKV